MDILFTVASAAFFIWIVRSTLFWLWLWQHNEYRLDRLRHYLFTTTHGRSVWLSWLLVFKFIGMLLYVPTVFDETMLPFYHFYVTGVFVLCAFVFVKELLTNTVKVPFLTLRILLLLVPSILLTVLFYYNPIIDTYLWFLLLDRFVLLCIALLLFALSFPTEIYRDYRLNIVKKLRKKYRNLTVVAVTGNVLKEGTVHIIAQLLQGTRAVVRTTDAQNGVYRLSRLMQRKVDYDTNVLVAEIGGYKPGEIQPLAEALRPDIAVVTDSAKHYEMFANAVDNSKTQLEVLTSLSPTGVGYINETSAVPRKTLLHLLQQFVKQKKKHAPTLLLYAVLPTEKQKVFGGISVKKLLVKKDGVVFDVAFGKTVQRFHTQLLGDRIVSQILPALCIGKQLGESFETLATRVTELLPLERHMLPYTLASGARIIDDSHPNDTEGILSSLRYMQQYKGKKIFVLTPLTTLHSDVYTDHYEIARHMAPVCDYLFITNKRFKKSILKGIYDSGSGCIIKYGSARSMASFIGKQLTSKDDVAVFSGEEAAGVVKEVLKRFH